MNRFLQWAVILLVCQNVMAQDKSTDLVKLKSDVKILILERHPKAPVLNIEAEESEILYMEEVGMNEDLLVLVSFADFQTFNEKHSEMFFIYLVLRNKSNGTVLLTKDCQSQEHFKFIYKMKYEDIEYLIFKHISISDGSPMYYFFNSESGQLYEANLTYSEYELDFKSLDFEKLEYDIIGESGEKELRKLLQIRY